MFMYYIYSLTYKGKVIYIGCSMNPATRLMDHLSGKCSCLKLGNVKNPALVTINILQVIKTRKNRVSQEVSKAEFYWVHKYLSTGHNLKNKVIRTKGT